MSDIVIVEKAGAFRLVGAVFVSANPVWNQ